MGSLIGFAVSALVIPLPGLTVWHKSIVITACMIVLSSLRGYVVRRSFERLRPTHQAEGCVQVARQEGLRHDGDKLRYDLIPGEWGTVLATILTHGAAKYEPRNWEKGMKWSRMVSALYRHLAAFLAGEPYDVGTTEHPGSRCHHLGAVAWNALALMSYDLRGIGEDDVVMPELKFPVTLPAEPVSLPQDE